MNPKTAFRFLVSFTAASFTVSTSFASAPLLTAPGRYQRVCDESMVSRLSVSDPKGPSHRTTYQSVDLLTLTSENGGLMEVRHSLVYKMVYDGKPWSTGLPPDVTEHLTFVQQGDLLIENSRYDIGGKPQVSVTTYRRQIDGTYGVLGHVFNGKPVANDDHSFNFVTIDGRIVESFDMNSVTGVDEHGNPSNGTFELRHGVCVTTRLK